MMNPWMAGLGALLMASTALAQSPPTVNPTVSAHVRKDIERHRAMAAAHEEAARCLASGKAEADCLKALQLRCKGLGIGKFCGMKHEH